MYMFMCIYIYIYTHKCVYIYIYVYTGLYRYMNLYNVHIYIYTYTIGDIIWSPLGLFVGYTNIRRQPSWLVNGMVYGIGCSQCLQWSIKPWFVHEWWLYPQHELLLRYIAKWKCPNFRGYPQFSNALENIKTSTIDSPATSHLGNKQCHPKISPWAIYQILSYIFEQYLSYIFTPYLNHVLFGSYLWS